MENKNMENYITGTVITIIMMAGLYASYKCLVKMTESKVKREAIISSINNR